MSIYERAWNALEEFYDCNIKNEYPNIGFDSSKKLDFKKYFNDEYNNIHEIYMDKDSEFLDRHKQAAILISDTIENKIFYETSKPDKNSVFIGLHQIAILLGLSYMLQSLNELLKMHGEKSINNYIFPNAISCDTIYIDILSRDLYFQDHTDNGVYILSLSHILFMIEYYTLVLKGIDTKILKED